MNSPNGQRRNYCGMRKHGTILRAAKTRSSAKVQEVKRRAIGAGEVQARVVSELLCIAAHAREPGFTRVLGRGAEAREEVGHGWTSITASIFASHRCEAPVDVH
jgi:hypothetical protein